MRRSLVVILGTVLLVPAVAFACSTASASIVAVAVQPASVNLVIGHTQQFTATGVCSDGSQQDLTAVVAWSSSAEAVASVDASGLATATAAGTSTITATFSLPPTSLTGSATLMVVSPIVSLAITPAHPILALHASLPFVATATLVDGSTQDVTRAATWSSSTPTVASIDAAGVASANAMGATVITATLGAHNGSVRLLVSRLGSPLAISPPSPRVLRNGDMALRASLGAVNLTTRVTWRSTAPAVASIDAGGHVHALAGGTTLVTAELGPLEGWTTLRVTTALPPVFIGQPTNTNVGAAIASPTGVSVRMTDDASTPLAGQQVSIALGNTPAPRATLSGTLSATTDATGVARFPGLALDWAGNGYTLLATATPISGAVAGTSAPFDELRVGDPCLGPEQPACQGSCSDADGDGLNDAWELAGGVDLNGDGKITDAAHDVLLPDADQNKPDVYVRYDWMDYAPPGNGCDPANDTCSALGFAHRGEKCIGPQTNPASPASCAYACNADTDCTVGSTNACASSADCSGRSYCDLTTNHCSVGDWHAGERCIQNVCQHTHDPALISGDSLKMVADRFQDHGINLHLLRGQPVPHSQVVSYRKLDEMTDGCEGGSVASGDAGLGKYAESLYDLKPHFDPDTANVAYHYAFFGHYVGCDDSEHCQSFNSATGIGCPTALNPDGTSKNAPVAGESGMAEISGNDFVVSFGGPVTDQGFGDIRYFLGATFMHELGHNLGLHHGGGIDRACKTDSDCPFGISCLDNLDGEGKACHLGDDLSTIKPNYLSIMSYRYQPAGIAVADAPGSSTPKKCGQDSDCPSGTFCLGACLRFDYSSQKLPVAGNSPGVLFNNDLNEPAGLGSGNADLFTYQAGKCVINDSYGPTDGAVDFDGDGDSSNLHAQSDLANPLPTLYCPGPVFGMSGSVDWPDRSGIPFNYKFQCTSMGGVHGDSVALSKRQLTAQQQSLRAARWQNEWNIPMAKDAHFAYRPRVIKLVVAPGCTAASITGGTSATFTIGILAEAGLDVSEIDVASISLHGAHPVKSEIVDLDHDGRADLLLSFDGKAVGLHPSATKLRLSGWLKSSQTIFGEAELSDTSSSLSDCR